MSQALSNLPDDIRQTVIDVVTARYEDIQTQLKLQTTAVSQTMLSDFDWQAKVRNVGDH